MSVEQLKAFWEAVEADTSLQEKLRATTDADSIASIAKEAGFEITADELKGFAGLVGLFDRVSRLLSKLLRTSLRGLSLFGDCVMERLFGDGWQKKSELEKRNTKGCLLLVLVFSLCVGGLPCWIVALLVVSPWWCVAWSSENTR